MRLSSIIKKSGLRVEYLLVCATILWLSYIIVNNLQEPEECCCEVCSARPSLPRCTAPSVTSAVTLSQPQVHAITTYRHISPNMSNGSYAAERPAITMRSTGMTIPMTATISSNAIRSTNGTTGSGIAHSSASHSSIAQSAPIAQSASMATPHTGITTSATAISGGVTSEISPRCNAPIRRISPPPTPDLSDWVDNGDGTITCVYCGKTIPEEDYYDVSHLHGYGICTAPTPLIEDLSTILFMAILACLYVLRRRRRDAKSKILRVSNVH